MLLELLTLFKNLALRIATVMVVSNLSFRRRGQTDNNTNNMHNILFNLVFVERS